MKLGFVSAILDGWSFEEMIDTARDLGFSCVEAACWPSGKAERRYAGVSHIDVDGLTDEKSAYILGYCKERGVELSSLAFYPNTMDEDLEKRAANIAHLKKVILASEKLGVGMVTTFVGRATHKTVEENLELFREIWPPIVAFAEEHHVKVAIENCPMWFAATNWPGGQNLFTTPDIWRRCFEILPSPSFGINYDPSHFIWQQMDYISPMYEYKDRIFHVHYKDIKLYPEKLARVGVMAYPLQYLEPKLPGLGDVNWAKYVSALTDIGYSGYTCIEVEDREVRLRLAAAAAGALRNAEEFEEGVVGASAVTRRDVDLLDRFDVHDRLDRILGRIGQIGIFIGFVGRKVRTEGGRTFDLAFDIFDFVGVRAVYRPHRYAARDGRNCNRS